MLLSYKKKGNTGKMINDHDALCISRTVHLPRDNRSFALAGLFGAASFAEFPDIRIGGRQPYRRRVEQVSRH